MARYYVNREIAMREAGRNTLAGERAREIANSYTPQAMSQLLANIDRLPTLPADAHLALASSPASMVDQIAMQMFQNNYDTVANPRRTALRALGAGALGARATGSTNNSPVAFAANEVKKTADFASDNIPGLGRAASAVGGAITTGAEYLGGKVPEPVRNTVKDISRPGMAILDAGPQMVQSSARSAYGAGQAMLAGDWQTAQEKGYQARFGTYQVDAVQMAGTALENLMAGDPLNQGMTDWGDGFFIAEDSEFMARKRAAEAKAATLGNGDVFTIGRGVAHHLGLEKGSFAYNGVSGTLDAVVAVGTPSLDRGIDKAVRAGGRGAVSVAGGVSEGTMLREIGGLRGMYDTVDVAKFEKFLTSRRAQPTINFMVDAKGADGWYDIWQATGKGKLDNFTINNLVSADNPDDVRRILVAAAGGGQTFGVSTAPRRAIRSASEDARIRMFDGDMPAGRFDLTDPEGAVLFADQVAATVKAPAEMRKSWVEAMGRADTMVDRRNAYSQIWGDTAAMLVDDGFQPARAKQLTQYMSDQLNTDRILIDEMVGMDSYHWGVLSVAGDPIRMPGAFLLSQVANTTLPVPDMRDLKRATSMWRPLFEQLENPATRNLMSEAGFSATTVPRRGSIADRAIKGLEVGQTAFKTSRLMRLAYPIRVLSWDAARLSAAGYDTGLNHPIRYVTSWISSKSGAKIVGEQVDVFGQKIGTWDEYVGLTATGNLDGMRGKFSTVASTEKIRIGKGTPKPEEYIKFWQDELATLAVDPFTVKVANSTSADEVVRWLADEGGSRYVKELEALVERPFDPADKFWTDYATSVSSYIQAATGGSDDLMDVVRSGQGATAINEMLSDGRLANLMDEFGPEAVAGFPTNSSFAQSADKAMDYLFDLLATRPSRSFSQLPLFQQAYNKGLIKFAPLADSGDTIIKAGQTAGLSKREMAVLKKALTRTKAEGTMPLEHIDALAKSFALDETKRLLYDASKNSQFFDSFRLVSVFGDAWKEEIQVWSSLIAARPTNIYRQGAQALDAAAEAGFFEENADGQMVFNYPFSKEISELFGMPTNFQGSATGLSLTGEVLPGLGPMAQIPAAEMIPNTSNWAAIRELAMPFGDPDAINSPSWVVPPWLDKVLAGGAGLTGLEGAWTQGNVNTFSNRKLDAMRYLQSTGEYDMADPTDRARLDRDAENRAQRLYLIHGLAQLVSPSAPIPQQQIIGPNGELFDTQVAVDRYRELQAEDYSTAPIKFLEEFGEENLLILASNTRSLTYGGIPMTKDALLWANENQRIIDAHPDLYGFLGPQDLDGEFSFDAYNRALETGELARLTDEEKRKLAEHRIASSIYRQYRAMIPENPNDEQNAILRDIKLELQSKYPGYGAIDSMGGRTPVWRIVDDGAVDAVLSDPNVEVTPTIEALREYWSMHYTVVELAKAEGMVTTGSGGWRQTNDGESFRLLLRSEGERLSLTDAGFARMWDEFLGSEFEDDLEN